MRLSTEEAVVLSDVGDDAQEVRHAGRNHLLWIQQRRDSQLRLRDLKSLQLVVLMNISSGERAEIYQVGSVFVDDGTEGQPIPERRGHVVNLHAGVTGACDAAPLQQSLP